jgi:iron donor protein CyaY
MTALSDQTFRLESDKAIEEARHALMPLSDEQGFELELQNGVLSLEFEEPAPTKFVVSSNAPTRQIWVAAMTKSYKLPWSPDLHAFAIDGESLSALLERLARTYLQLDH